MSDASAPAPAKKAAAKPKKPADHPPVAEMVKAAISNLKERKGSSLAAIKKYVVANYKVDAAKIAPFIRRFLKKAVADGKLVQTKGTGASGSFKLSKVKEEKPKKVVKKKPAAKKPAAKKDKKAKTPKKAAKKAKTPKKSAKSPKKTEKKAKKPKAAKPKKPKAKKATKSPKKAAKPKKPAAKKSAKKAN